MGNHSKKKSYPKTAGVLSMIGTIIIIVALAVSALLVIPGFAGVNMFCIATQSMEPDIPVGSLVVIEPVDPQDLEVGDIVSYRDDSNMSVPVTHRVVENDMVEWQLVTKGDANAQPDPMPVSYGQVIGVMTFSIPLLGYVAVAASTAVGKICLALIVVAGLIMCVVADRIRRRA